MAKPAATIPVSMAADIQIVSLGRAPMALIIMITAQKLAMRTRARRLAWDGPARPSGRIHLGHPAPPRTET